MGYDPSLHRVLRDSEASHPWFRARAGLVAHFLERFAPASPSVLDEGCGTGWTSSRIAGIVGPSVMVGADVSTSEAASARHPGVALVRSDMAKPPFGPAFDALLLLDVLEHFEDEGSVLESVSSTLVPGGLLVVTVPAMPLLWSRYDEACGHCRRYTRRSLLDLLNRCGFESVFTSYFMCLLAPAVLLMRRLRLQGSRDPGGGICDHEFHPGRLVSGIAAASASLEKLVLTAGLRLPWGSSLLALARRR